MKNHNEASASLRFGHVTEYDPASHSARVSFPDSGIVSMPLPILTHNTLSHHDEAPLSPGEHVACLMMGNGSEIGVILGAFYDAKIKPPVHEEHTRAITISDGTKIAYDAEEHKLLLEIHGDMEVSFSDGTKYTYDSGEHKVYKEIHGDTETYITGESVTETHWEPEL